MGHVKIIQSGSTFEIYRYEKDLPVRRSVRRSDSYGKRNRGTRPRDPSSIRRAKKAFIRLVRANLVGDARPTLLTLTMSQKLSYSASVGIFSQFVVRFRRRYGSQVAYIAVPEFQKRGAVHWHVLVFNLHGEAYKAEYETRAIARLWLRGFVDCVKTDGSPKLAGYLAKYMSKSMSDIRICGKKAYYTSRNIMRPLSYSSSTLAIYLDDIEPVDNLLLRNFQFDTQWLGKCDYKLYNVDYADKGKSDSSLG